MPFVQKEVLNRLLTDEESWMVLLQENYESGLREGRQSVIDTERRKAEAKAEANAADLTEKLRNTEATLREQESLTRTYAKALSSQQEQRDLALSSQQEQRDLALSSQQEQRDLALRQAALDPAAGVGEGDVVAKAREFEKFLRGETDPVHNDADRVDGLEESVRLVNSGWNSALEYLLGSDLSEFGADAAARIDTFLNGLRREA